MTMTLLGIILMVAGFIGVLVCAKLQKSNPSIQPVAVICALVMIAGLIVYGYNYMNGSSGSAETAEIYARATGRGIGNFLKSAAAGKKVYFVVNPGAETSAYALNQKDEMQKACGSSVDIISIEVPDEVREAGDLIGFLKPKHIDDLVARDETAVYVLDIGMPEKGAPQCFNKPDGKRPAIFLSNTGMVNDKNLKKWIKDGKIIGILIGNPAKRDPNFEPSLRKLDETFNRQYVVVDKSNLDSYKDRF